MRDMNGEILKVGDYVQYLRGGDINNPSPSTLVVKHIIWEVDETGTYKTFKVEEGQLPFADLIRVRDDDTQNTPFYSRELRKLGPEELI